MRAGPRLAFLFAVRERTRQTAKFVESLRENVIQMQPGLRRDSAIRRQSD